MTASSWVVALERNVEAVVVDVEFRNAPELRRSKPPPPPLPDELPLPVTAPTSDGGRDLELDRGVFCVELAAEDEGEVDDDIEAEVEERDGGDPSAAAAAAAVVVVVVVVSSDSFSIRRGDGSGDPWTTDGESSVTSVKFRFSSAIFWASVRRRARRARGVIDGDAVGETTAAATAFVVVRGVADSDSAGDEDVDDVDNGDETERAAVAAAEDAALFADDRNTTAFVVVVVVECFVGVEKFSTVGSSSAASKFKRFGTTWGEEDKEEEDDEDDVDDGETDLVLSPSFVCWFPKIKRLIAMATAKATTA